MRMGSRRGLCARLLGVIAAACRPESAPGRRTQAVSAAVPFVPVRPHDAALRELDRFADVVGDLGG